MTPPACILRYCDLQRRVVVTKYYPQEASSGSFSNVPDTVVMGVVRPPIYRTRFESAPAYFECAIDDGLETEWEEEERDSHY